MSAKDIERLAGLIEGYCDRPSAAETVVRAILQALREPSEGLSGVVRSIEHELGCSPGEAHRAWRTGIDHLLAD